MIASIIFLIVIGIFGYYKNIEKQHSTRQKELSTIYQDLTKGHIYQMIQELTDKEGDFLAVNISREKLEKANKSLAKHQKEVDKIRKRDKKLSTKNVDVELGKATEKLVVINKKFDCQESLSHFFEGGKQIVNGSELPKECVIKEDVTAKQIEKINKKVNMDKQLSGKWKEAILKIIKEGTEQATTIQQLKDLLATLYVNDKPKPDVSEEKYQEALKLLETIKNETIKKKYESKVSAIKTTIEAEQRAKMEWSSLEEATAFLKNVLENEKNAGYQIKNYISFADDKEWRIMHKEGNLIDVVTSRVSEPGGNAGGASVYRLEKKEGLVDLTYYGGAFYPNEPDKRYEIDCATYKINSVADLVLERAAIEKANRPPYSEVIEIFLTIIQPLFIDGLQIDRDGFIIVESEDTVEINPKGMIWTCVARPSSQKITYELKDHIAGKFVSIRTFSYDLQTKQTIEEK